MPKHNFAYKKIRVEDAVGLSLAHDITEIRKDEFKGVAFPKGYMVKQTDICHLMKLGKQHLYILDLDETTVHEDEAVLELARALAGNGVVYTDKPREGKLELLAAHDGLLKINVEGLIEFNMIPEVMCASLHTNTPVKRKAKLAGTRAIPLVIDRAVLDLALDIAGSNAPIFEVRPFKKAKARLIVTGSEVFNGLIKDRFEPIVQKKMQAYGSKLVESIILPDDRDMISKTLKDFLAKDTDIIITTGGMSVDPDDVTRFAIKDAGVDKLFYSAAVLPGAMFQLAYKKDIPIVGIPACGLYHEITVFDLVLPRLLAGEKPDNRDMARLAHGGLCQDCNVCSYPACSFGKSF
ncbi:MAG: molybdopterin-binding protein [Proteobacteria bacterium]|nr:molybdopterin-binding protein [Pseudomonadota bacterium]MBU1586136.1 molybdopterin-binding protein [Pseudomonadota bacterium]MBU2453507.1 molybdopterin-binding protein [Pseudomonadota bacterium]MBU2631078.1 molybdopterin-binding protein [Pseudomonadota bacterium]